MPLSPAQLAQLKADDAALTADLAQLTEFVTNPANKARVATAVTAAGKVSADIAGLVADSPPPPPPLVISTTNLPSGTVGVAYSAQLAATGGTAPYTWSSAGLPAGLSLSASGAITGTPTAAGSTPVSVKVTDSSTPQLSASAQLNVVIAVAVPPPPPPKPIITGISPATSVEGVAATTTITGTNLSGASVTIGGQTATILNSTASLVQVNVPLLEDVGSVPVVVTTLGGTASTTYMLTDSQPPPSPTLDEATPTASTGIYDNMAQAGVPTLVIQNIKGNPSSYQVFETKTGAIVASGPFPSPSPVDIASVVGGSHVAGGPLSLTPTSAPKVGDTLVVTGVGASNSNALAVSGGNAEWNLEQGVNTNMADGYPLNVPFILIGQVVAAGAAPVEVTINGSGTFSASLAHVQGLASFGVVDQSGFDPSTPLTPSTRGELVVVAQGISQGSFGSTPVPTAGSPLVLAPGNTPSYVAGFYVQPVAASLGSYGWASTGGGVKQSAYLVLSPAAGGTVLAIPAPNGVGWNPGHYTVVFNGTTVGAAGLMTDSVMVSVLRAVPGVNLPTVAQLPAFNQPDPGMGNDLSMHWAAGFGPERYGISDATAPTEPASQSGEGQGFGDTIAGVEAVVVTERAGGYLAAAWADPLRPRPALLTFPNDIVTAANQAIYEAGVTQACAALGPGTAADMLYVEGLNEPVTVGVNPPQSAAQFAVFSAAAKAGNPAILPVGPSDVTHTVEPFLTDAIAAGQPPKGVSVHLYNDWNGDFLVFDAVLAELRAQIDAHPETRGVPILCTEAGNIFFDFAALYLFDPMRFAAWWTQFLHTGERYGLVKELVAYYYDRNHGAPFCSWLKGNDSGLHPQPVVTRVYTEEMENKTYLRPLTFGEIGDNLYRANVMSGPGGACVVLFAQGMLTDTCSLSGCGTAPVVVSDGMGAETTVAPDAQGNVTFAINQLCTYVRIPLANALTVAVASAGGGVGNAANAATGTTPLQKTRGPSGTLTLPYNVTAGDTLTLVSTNFSILNIVSVTGGGTWVKAVGVPFSAGGSGTVDLWYCENATGGPTTVQITWKTGTVAPNTPEPVTVLAEWPPCVIDHVASVTNGNGAPGVPSFTPKAGELVIELVAVGGEVSTTPVGWTELDQFALTAAGHASCQYDVTPSTAPIAAKWGPSLAFSAGVMTFTPKTGAFQPAAVASCASGAPNVDLINDGEFQPGSFYGAEAFCSTAVPESITYEWPTAVEFNDVIIRQLPAWSNIGPGPNSTGSTSVMLAGTLEYWNGTAWVPCPTVPGNHWDDAGNYFNPTAYSLLSNVGHDGSTNVFFTPWDYHYVHNVPLSETVTTTQFRWTVTAVSRGHFPDTLNGAGTYVTPQLAVSELLLLNT